MRSFLYDLRFAMRQLRKAPAFSLLAICTLAIGIGASTAIYSIVDGVLLRSLPYKSPQRLVTLYESIPVLSSLPVTFSAPDLHYVEQHANSFSGIAAYRDQQYELSGTGSPVRVHAARVNASLYPVLGVSPVLGRVFTQEEDISGAPVVVLSNKFWRQQLGASRDAIGQKVLLDRKPYTIIGVMPRSFVFPNRGEKFNDIPGAIFTPMHFTPEQLQDLGNQFNYSVIARLKPDIPLARASAEVNGLIHQFSQQYPVVLRSTPGFSLGGEAAWYNEQVVGRARSPLLLLQLSVLLVLLIACVDVANLLLARTTGRQRELALRIAVGAPRARIVSQLLSESLLLAITGGLLGLPLAYGAMHLLITSAPIDLPRAGSVSLNAGVLAFCFGICLLTALLTGLIPALRALRIDPNQDLYEGGRSGMTGRGHHRILGTLVTSQFALAMVLLVTAGLLLRSFQRLMETDPGFRPDHVITMSATLPLTSYSSVPQIENFYKDLLDRVVTLPGARQAAVTTELPMVADENDIFSVEALPSQAPVSLNAVQTWTMGDYFGALGVRLVRGRFFTPQDRDGAQPVAIINQALAKKYFHGVDPIGHRIKNGTPESKAPWMTIVGVVDDMKNGALNEAVMPATFTPYLQMIAKKFFIDPNIDELRGLTLVVRTQQEPNSMRNLLVSTIHSIDPSLPVTNIRTMTGLLHTSVAPQRFNSFILGTFALIALLLAAAGIGGVLAYTVHQRTREIGVRMALGAQRGDVSRLVLMEGMKLACKGIVLGGIFSLLTAHWLASQLYEVSPHDPLTFLTGLGILLVIAGIACWVPARRAAAVDPMQALRSE